MTSLLSCFYWQGTCSLFWVSVFWLEWTSSHQCTSWGWARSARFADEHPPCPRCFFFPPLLCPTYLPPPIPPPTLNLPPPSYLPPTNPTPPHSIARARVVERKLELWSYCCGAVLELWSCCCGAKARAAGVGAGPTRPRSGKLLTFFFFFVCFVWRGIAALQQRIATQHSEEGFLLLLHLLLLLFLFCCQKKKRRRRRQQSCHRLLRCHHLLHCHRLLLPLLSYSSEGDGTTIAFFFLC